MIFSIRSQQGFLLLSCDVHQHDIVMSEECADEQCTGEYTIVMSFDLVQVHCLWQRCRETGCWLHHYSIYYTLGWSVIQLYRCLHFVFNLVFFLNCKDSIFQFCFQLRICFVWQSYIYHSIQNLHVYRVLIVLLFVNWGCRGFFDVSLLTFTVITIESQYFFNP